MGKMWGKEVFAFAFFFFVASFPKDINGVAVMSVDIGSEWLKVAIVSPGVPMEIALNKESKRKTPMMLSFRGNERTFGEDAQINGLRFPKSSFSHFIDLLGKPIDHPIVRLYSERFPHHELIANEETNTVAFRTDDNTTHMPEELLAQMLHKSREFAENSARQKIKGAVIIVPPYFNQAERRAVMQAAELADLKVLQLLNDNIAIALNYGIFRRKEINETSQYVLFYDMGASSTRATIVSYQNVKSKDKGYAEVIPQLSVLGIGYDRTLGGLEIQIRLRDYLAREFDRMGKTKNSVFKNPRAMAKLFKEAGRVKNILSANSDHFAQVEGLLDEKDFRFQVTREKLEEICADVFERIGGPIQMALDVSGLSLDLISQVVLVGAGTRMPKIQEKLVEIVKTDLAKNINTDEAAVLGAVYKAAELSEGFKVKKFITKDAVHFPIQIVFDRNIDGRTKQVRKTLFGKMNTYPQKKIITFNKHKEDFEFTVQYAELDHLPKHEQLALGSLALARVQLTGVAEAYEKHAQQKADSKGIRAHFKMDDSGILHLQTVELMSEKSGQIGRDEEEGSDGNENAEKVEAKQKDDVKPVHEEVPESSSTDQGEKSTAQNQTKTSEEKVANRTEKVEKKPTITTITDVIMSSVTTLGPRTLQGEKLQQSRNKIKALNDYDREKMRRETALNSLEAFVIDAKQKVETDEYKAASTAEELQTIAQACDQIQDWLYEDGFDAAAEVYEDKLQTVQKLTNDLYERVFEHRERPDALKGMSSMINGSTIFLRNMRNLTEAEEIFTVVEMETFERILNETQNYYDEILGSLKDTALFEPIKYRVQDIANKMAILDREVKYLVNKAKIWKPKTEKPLTGAPKPSEDQLPKGKPVSESTIETPEKAEDITIENEDLATENATQGQEDETLRSPEDITIDEKKLETKDKTQKLDETTAKTKKPKKSEEKTIHKEVDDDSHEEL
ncbi:hypoxia up-regulated protein 1 isoform X2 [Venturia canescens]|uniref:hypoxia up-regulated protein 1 isoform X2 n=1 Tax=Venturia canescens TaxID=32260 RepID=UPI001C9CD3D6|nr:hypoxia up-regulated protein 1 isoform X2 [Venturia canescens]